MRLDLLTGAAGAVCAHALGEIILVYELRLAGAGLRQLFAESDHIHGSQGWRRCGRAARKDARQEEWNNPYHARVLADSRGPIMCTLR